MPKRLSRFLRNWLKDILAAYFISWQLFIQHLARQYRYSSLGLFWIFVPTILTALVLIGGQQINSKIADSGISSAFYGIFGLAMGQTFIDSITATRRLFEQNKDLLRRQNVAIDGMIIAGVLDVSFTMLVRFLVLGCLFFLFAVTPSFNTLAIAVGGFFGILLLGAGLGLFIAPLNSLKRDIDNAMALLPWSLFALTPVFVPAKHGTIFGLICSLNPLTWLFDSIRVAAYGAPGTIVAAALSPVIGFFVLCGGWAFCRVSRPHVVERML